MSLVVYGVVDLLLLAVVVLEVVVLLVVVVFEKRTRRRKVMNSLKVLNCFLFSFLNRQILSHGWVLYCP